MKNLIYRTMKQIHPLGRKDKLRLSVEDLLSRLPSAFKPNRILLSDSPRVRELLPFLKQIKRTSIFLLDTKNCSVRQITPVEKNYTNEEWDFVPSMDIVISSVDDIYGKVSDSHNMTLMTYMVCFELVQWETVTIAIENEHVWDSKTQDQKDDISANFILNQSGKILKQSFSLYDFHGN